MSKSVVPSKQIVFPEAFRVEYETKEYNLQSIPSDGVFIRTEYSLISPGTELAFYTGTHIDLNNPKNKWAKLPFYPGYASVGEVTAVGSSIQHVNPGQKVMALGHHATYDVIPYSEESLIAVPDNIDLKLALFARLAEISSTALIHSRVQPGQSVVVIGMGLIGNLAAQLYALQGARVFGVDIDEQRLHIARETNGLTTILSKEGEDLPGKVMEKNGGHAPDVVVEATGNPALCNVALDLVREHGQVILLGSPRGSAEINIYRNIHSKGVSLIGAHGNIKGMDGLPTSAVLLRYVMDLIANRQLVIEPLISHILPYDEAPHAYDMLYQHKDHALGIILDWSASEKH